MTFSVLFCCERKGTKNNSVFNWKVLLFKFTKYGAKTIKVMWLSFTIVVCRISSRLKWYKNFKNRLSLAKVIVKNKLQRFFVVHCVYYLLHVFWRWPAVTPMPGHISIIQTRILRSMNERRDWPRVCWLLPVTCLGRPGTCVHVWRCLRRLHPPPTNHLSSLSCTQRDRPACSSRRRWSAGHSDDRSARRAVLHLKPLTMCKDVKEKKRKWKWNTRWNCCHSLTVRMLSFVHVHLADKV